MRLGRLQEDIAPLQTRMAEMSWQVATGGGREAARELERTGQEIIGRLSRREDFLAAERLRAEQLDGVSGRVAEVMYRQLLEFQGDVDLSQQLLQREIELQQLYAEFRPTVRGGRPSRNDLEQTLEATRDPAEAEEAWRAGFAIGASSAPLVRDAVRLRNRRARGLGFENHYALSLFLQEIEPGHLRTLMGELEQATRASAQAVRAELGSERRRQFGLAPSAELSFWHLGERFFQHLPAGGPTLDGVLAGRDLVPPARVFFRSLGFDVDAVLERSDLYEREGKNQHAFCTHIDRRSDVRVLCNLRPTQRWMGTLLHELGHAVYMEGIDRALPYALRDGHIANHEAISTLMDGHIADGAWLADAVGPVDPELLRAVHRREMMDLVVFTRFALVMVEFERRLYADPEADLGAVWWRLVEEIQGVPAPAEPRPDDWAVKDHIATAPVYYHNYLLGYMTMAQLRGHLEEISGRPGIYGSGAAGERLREAWFRPGLSLRWDQLVAEVTGAPLSPRAMLQRVRSAG